MSKTNYLPLLLAILFIKTVFLAWFIQTGQIGLGPDEAQYWNWSRDLSLGYYSKPPGIAWQIWLGTKLFGNTELGVRFGSLILGILLPLATLGLANGCGLKPSTSFWAGLTMAFIPLGILASILAITDGAMVLFWTLACTQLAVALKNRTKPNDLLLGFLILCGALFKWTMYYFWIVALVSMVFCPFLASWQVLFGMALSLLGLVPSLVWNRQHDWVTFRHVFSTIHTGTVHNLPAQGNFWAFVGEQAALLSPLLFVLLLIGLFHSFSKKPSLPVKFCGLVFAGIVGIFCGLSLFKKIQGNWCDFAYPAGVVFLCWYACEATSLGKRWLQAGLAVSIILCALIFSVPALQSKGIELFGFKIPYKWNLFRHNVGWDRLALKLHDLGYDPQKNFLFGDKYQTSSILGFYSEGQKRAYFLNLHGIRLNQFSFWPGMELEQKGVTGYFVLPENKPNFSNEERRNYLSLLQQYFDKVELVAVESLFFSYGRPVKSAMILKCTGYNGKIPEAANLY